jgi:SAM-dependent methyltransferase
MDIRSYNSAAWDGQVRDGNRWTVPVSSDVIAAARRGEWTIQLTTTLPVPAEWLPPVADCRVLCLAGGGGQQGPILAAAGAVVTVLDNSPAQLAQDRLVAEREGLALETVTGDMADLGGFGDARFDLIINPASSCFVPDLRPVWRESYRVLRPGGALLSGHMNPAYYLFDFAKSEQGILDVRYTLPYADPTSLDKQDLARHLAENTPHEFSHTLETLIGGQLSAGFVLTGFYEDRFAPEDGDTLSRYMATLLATRAEKPAPVRGA